MSRISRKSSYHRLIFCVKKIGHYYTYILGYCLLSARFYIYIYIYILVLSDIKFVYILIYMYMHVLFKVLFIIG